MALLVGLDVGSTTTKVYAMHEDMTEAWWGYRRHGACQTASVRAMLGELAERFPHESLRVAVTGSGARDIATALGASYVQEVVANALAISRNVRGAQRGRDQQVLSADALRHRAGRPRRQDDLLPHQR